MIWKLFHLKCWCEPTLHSWPCKPQFQLNDEHEMHFKAFYNVAYFLNESRMCATARCGLRIRYRYGAVEGCWPPPTHPSSPAELDQTDEDEREINKLVLNRILWKCNQFFFLIWYCSATVSYDVSCPKSNLIGIGDVYAPKLNMSHQKYYIFVKSVALFKYRIESYGFNYCKLSFPFIICNSLYLAK